MIGWALGLYVFMDDEFLVVFINGGKEFVMACFDFGIVNCYIFEEG